MNQTKVLIFIPTYNESENVVILLERLMALGLDADIVFMDDNSPDGTGKILDLLAEHNPRLKVLHRTGKLGIGSAHQEGIAWAYARGYTFLITMDCDFTHPPEILPELLKYREDYDVVIGSRYMLKDSLEGWNIYRKILTKLGHFLTALLLRLKYDATGALRLYRLDKIPPYAFNLVTSRGYSFFYESLFILNFNHFRIKEIPIKLPVRTYGHSKMRLSDAWQGFKLLIVLFWGTLFERHRFEIVEPFRPSIDPLLTNDQDWETYWAKQKNVGGLLYDLIAVIYRKFLIKPFLNCYIKKYFKRSSAVLHAGCGSGQVDEDICKYVRITAMDYSVNALNLYKKVNKNNCQLLYGSIFQIPLPDHSLDGIYNLGVMEHYDEADIKKILSEFKRVLRPEGKVVIFWPPEFGLSVMFMKVVHFILQEILKKDTKMHPDEICRIRSRRHVESIVAGSGFKIIEYYFGLRDLFTQCVVVLDPQGEI